MAVYVVRHGCAGDKREWPGPDDERPLDDAGMVQAGLLAVQLATTPIEQILSSPAWRCRQTVEPLAERHGLGVEPHDGLGVDAGAPSLEALLAAVGAGSAGDGHDVVLCTHGEVMRPLLAGVRRAGIPITAREDDDDWLLAKGSAWRLTLDGAGGVTGLEHVLPQGSDPCARHH